MTPSIRKSLLALVAVVATSLSCGREVTGPGAGGRWATGLSLAPQFPAAMQATSGANLVDFTRVRVLFRRSDGGVALDRTIDFPEGADSIALNVNVPLSAAAPETGEPMSLVMYYLDAAGDTVFTGGPVQLLVRPSAPGDLPPAPIPVPVRYTGPGSSATRVAIAPRSSTVSTGDVVQFSAQAFNAQNVALAGTPVDYRSLDTTLVRVGATGTATAQARRGVAQVVARLLTGQEDTATVTVQLRASQIAVATGNGQTGAAGAALALPLVVRVLAADSVPVAGVPVTFAATGGGAPGQATVNTDASGLASTTWTLGATLGAQTMTATATGLTGSPVTFTADVIAGPPTALVFTSQPATTVAGVAIAPAVVVTARDALGLTAGGFADSVSIALASNPSAGTLSGVRTVAAVNGVATFAGLSLDRVGAGYTLTATSAGLTTATSTGFAITPAPASTLTFTVQPAGGIPGATFAPAPQVTARDAFGNTAAYAGTVTLALGANPGSASLNGTTSVTAVSGVATFDNVQLSAPGVGYTFVASAAGLSDATSDAFTVGTGANAWTNASGGNWSVASNWSAGRVPDATDAVEISLAGTYTVTVDVNPSIASLQLGGASGTQTLAMSGRTFTAGGTVQVDANGALAVTNSTVTGGGALLNLGRVTSAGSTIAVAVDNRGLLVASGSSAITGTLTNQSGAILRVAQVDGSTSVANLTVANGLANAGAIELTTVFSPSYSAQLTVTAGTLVNAIGGTISALPGTAAGGTRTIVAQLDNQGSVVAGMALTISGVGAVHINSGSIDATLGNIALNQGGTGASFTNSGTITVGAGRTLSVTGGGFVQDGGDIAGAGNLSFSSATLTLGSAFSNVVTGLALSGSTVNGPGTLTNTVGRTLTLAGSAINAPFVNLGTVTASGTSAITAAFANQAGALLRVAQADGSTSLANLTVATGMTNAGAIEITNVFSPSYSAQLTVTAGTLVNAPGGTISSLPGTTPGGTRTLSAPLDNQGTVTVEMPLTINGASAVHLNSGTIDATLANLTLIQSGTTPSFTNSGTITVGAGRTLAISGGAFDQNGGTIAGSGTVSVNGSTLNLAIGFSTAVTGLTLTNATVNGPATLTNAAGRTLALAGTTINAPFVNLGTATASGTSAITAAFANQAGALLRVAQADGSTSLANLTVANGMTNAGAIEITNVFSPSYSAQLTVTGGTLVNAPGGTISSLPGTTPGGTRTLAGSLDNQGTVTVGMPLAITGSSAVHLNSGTIDVTLANLSVVQSGTSPSFSNSGTITVGAGRTLTISGGAFNNQSGGTFSGVGSVTLSGMTVTLGAPLSTAVAALTISNSIVNGAAALTNTVGRTLTLAGTTVNAPFDNLGTVTASGNTAITGTFTNQTGALLRVAQADGTTSLASLTVATGFTNAGAIELTNVFSPSYSAQLTVTAGTLVNAPGGTISSLPGTTPGGTRTLVAQLDNQGTVTLEMPLSFTRASAAHVNSGTINATLANLSVVQSGTSPSFTNSGAIAIGAGRTVTVSGGTFTDQSGSVSGAGTLVLSSMTAAFNGTSPSVATLSLSGVTASVGGALTSGSTSFIVTNSTLTGAGSLTNVAGRTFVLDASTLAIPFLNEGTLLASAASALSGALTTAVGSIIRVGQINFNSGTATLTVANGFTNNGAIELTNAVASGYSAALVVGAGTLTNGASGTITSTFGAATTGPRTLTAQLDNQGLLTVLAALTMNGSGFDHLNAGSIDVSGGNLTVTLAGTTPTFTNTGSLAIGAGRTVTVTGGAFTSEVGATIAGAGSLTLNGSNVAAFSGAQPAVGTLTLATATASFASPVSNASTDFSLTNATLNGTGPFSNAAGRTLTLDASTLNMPLDNQGTLLTSAASALSGALTTAVGSIIRVGQLNFNSGTATLTVANGFTNNGLLELTNAVTSGYGAQLIVTTGTLTNAAGGVLTASFGAATSGPRTILAPVNNLGTLNVYPGAAGRLNINGSLTNAGTINMELGGTTVATQYDQILVGGSPSSATLGGTINVALFNGFTPPALSTYALISTGTGPLSGTFSVPNLLGFSAAPTYTGSLFSLVVP